MPAISAGDLATLRLPKHRIKPYLSALVPRDLWTARVNLAAPDNGETTIPFDGGAGLDFSAVEVLQTVWVGTAAGLNDIGTVRVKGISGAGTTGTLTASPNSLNWIDNAYLTFKHDYELRPMFPFIEPDGTFKKDHDVAYSDQNSEPPPVCIAGPHRAVWLGDDRVNLPVAEDFGSNSVDAVYSGDVVLTGNGARMGDEDANEGRSTIPVAGLNAAGFSFAIGGIIAYAKQPSQLSTSQRLIQISNAGGEFVAIDYPTSIGRVIGRRVSLLYDKGGFTDELSGGTDYHVLGLTYSVAGSFARFYVDGVLASQSTTDIVAFATASATSAIIGDTSTTTDWHGTVRDIVITLGVAPSADNMAEVSIRMRNGTLSTAVLDGLFGAGAYIWYKHDEEYNQTASLAVDLRNSYVITQGASMAASYTASVYPTAGVTSSVIGAGTGTITFSTAGQRWVKYSCTDSNGQTQTTYRCYFVYDRAGTQPFTDFTVNNITGDWERGGWTAGIQLNDNADLATIPDRALAILWADWEYEDGEVSTPISFLPDDNNALIVGYIRNDKLAQNEEDGTGTDDIEISTIDGLLRNKYNFPVSLEATSGTPSKWYQYEDWLTVGRALHHLYRWHSTLLSVADFYGFTDNADRRPYAEMEDNDLYSMGDTLSRHRGIRQHITCDRGGRLRLVDDPQLLNDAGRAALTGVAELTDDDRSGTLSIVRQMENRTCFVHVSGFYWDGTYDGDGKPQPNAICAIAPGDKPSDDGPSITTMEKQTLSGQTDANEIAGRVYAIENNLYPEVRVGLHGNYLGVLEPALNDYWTINLQTGDTIKEIVWSDKKLFLKNVTAALNVDEGTIDVKAVFEPEADGDVGISTDCPEFPDIGGDDYPIEDEEGGDGGDIMTAASLYLFNPNANDWSQVVAEATSDAYPDPWWRDITSSEDIANAIIWRGGVGYIKRSDDGGSTWDTVTPASDPPNEFSDTPAPTAGDVTYMRGEASWITQETHVWMATWQNGSDEWRTWVLLTEDNGTSWVWESVGVPGSGGTGGTFAMTAGSQLWLQDAKSHSVLKFGDDHWIVLYSSNTGPTTAQWVTEGVDSDGNLFFGASGGSAVPFNTPAAMAKLTDLRFHLFCIGTAVDNPGTAFPLCCWGAYWDAGYTLVGNDYEGFAGDYLLIGNVPTAIAAEGVDSTHSLVVVNRHPVTLAAGLYGCVFTDTGVSVGGGTWATLTTDPVVDVTISKVVRGGGDKFHVFFIDNSNTKGIELSISGDTITPGTAQTVSLSVGTLVKAAPVSANDGYSIVAYTKTSAGDGLYGRVVNMTNTTISTGTEEDIKIQETFGFYMSAATSSTALIAYQSDPDGDSLGYRTLTATGTTLSTSGEGAFPVDNGYKPMITPDIKWWVAAATTGSSVYIDIDAEGGNIRGLGMSLGKATGELLYVTGWNQVSEMLELQVFSVPDLVLQTSYNFGGATEAEVIARTYVMYPLAPFGSDELLYLYGRMDVSGGVHVFYSEDSGASNAVVEDSWGTDHCGALYEDFGTLYAIRNVSGGAKVYVGSVDGLNLKSTSPLNDQINHRAIDFDWYNGLLYIGSGGADAVMVVRISDPFLEWENITFDHPTGSGINAVFKV